MPDGRAGAVVVAGRKRALHIVQAARREAEPDHIDRKVLAFRPHGGGQMRRVNGSDAVSKMLGDRGGGKGFGHECGRCPVIRVQSAA